MNIAHYWRRAVAIAVMAVVPLTSLGAEDAVRPTVMKFDFGPKGQQDLAGFTGVDPETAYTPQRGYGFTIKPKTAVAGGIADPLANDSVLEATFQVDLPNGSYEVGIWTGYLQWGGNYAYTWANPQIVTANGVSLVNLTITPEIYQRDFFFKCSDTDVTPGTDLWKTFVDDWFPYKQATVEVKDGKLKVQNSGNAYLNGLVIAPSAKKEELAGDLAAAAAARRKVFEQGWLPGKWAPATPPPPTADEQRLGYILFQPDTVNLAQPSVAPRPEQRAGEVRVFAARGEYEPATLGIFPLNDAASLSVSVSDMMGPDGAVLPAGEVEVRLVRMYATPGPTFTPFYMVPAAKVALLKGLPRQFWFTLHVPEGAKPGFYRGSIEFSSERGSRRVGLLLNVLDLSLPDVTKKETGAPLFEVPYYGPTWYSWLGTAETAAFGKAKGLAYLKADLQFMRERGLSPSATLHGTSITDFYKLTREMGYTIPISDYGLVGGPVLLGWDTNVCPLEKETGFAPGTAEFNKVLFAYLDKVLAGWEKEGVPPGDILFNVTDEIGSHQGARGAEKARKILQAIHDYGKVHTIVFADGPVELQNLPVSDWFVMSYYAMPFDQPLFDQVRASKAHLGVYTLGLTRMGYGFYLWRTGAQMHWCWHYFIWGGAPYNTVGSNTMGYLTVPGVDGPLPTIQSEAVREGIDDYRYVLCLDKLMAQAEKSKNEKVVAQLGAARQARGETWDFVDPNWNRLNGAGTWTPEVYGKLRWRIARAALELQTALRDAGDAK